MQRERDLCLYKFYDIFLYIKKYLDKSFLNELCVRVKNLGLEKECLYTFINCKEIFKSLEQNYLMCNLIGKLMIEDISFMKKIYWPEKKRTFMYDKSFKEWFSCNRKDNLILLEDYSNGKNQ